MTTDAGRTGGFVRVLVAVAASLSLVGGLALAGVAARWYSLRTVGTDATTFVPTASADGATTGSCSTDPCTYLLLGSDSRSGLSADQQKDFGTNQDIGGETRSDTIMLVHTDPALQKAIVVSFPRDLWVQIPGRGMDKINAAFEGGIEGGGAQRVADTVTALTNIPIDHYLYVDLNGFQRVVDTLGGVEMCVPGYNVNTPGWVEGGDANGNPTQIYYGEPGHIVDPYTGLDVEPGCQTFGGDQALAYVRSRHLPCDLIPDFARIGRQQQFMRAVINQMLEPAQLAKAPGLVGPVLASLHRDRGFLPGDLVYLVGQLRGLSTGAVEFRSVPGTPAMVGTQSVVVMDTAAKEIFRAIREGRSISDVGTQLDSTAPSEANTTVLVLDTGNPTGASETEDLLSGAGFDVSPGVQIGDGPAGVRGSAIAYRPSAEAYAKVVATYFPDLPMVAVPGLGAPVAVVTAKGYHPSGPDASGGDAGGAAECPTPTA
jgi:anionic cell wall polymer biosynthesis LytR-Cps2A-Psr (LCP) family protein